MKNRFTWLLFLGVAALLACLPAVAGKKDKKSKKKHDEEESSMDGDEFQANTVLEVPTPAPSVVPSDFPSLVPSDMPSDVPSMVPTTIPTKSPSLGSDYPSIVPTGWGTPKPTTLDERWATPDARRLATFISREREQRRKGQMQKR